VSPFFFVFFFGFSDWVAGRIFFLMICLLTGPLFYARSPFCPDVLLKEFFFDFEKEDCSCLFLGFFGVCQSVLSARVLFLRRSGFPGILGDVWTGSGEGLGRSPCRLFFFFNSPTDFREFLLWPFFFSGARVEGRFGWTAATTT